VSKKRVKAYRNGLFAETVGDDIVNCGPPYFAP
jgi:hypothetical protein